MIDVLDKKDKAEVFRWLVKNHHIPILNRIDFIGSHEVNVAEFDINAMTGIIQVKYPPIAADLQDNQFIESYLQNTFGDYKKFIKQYMAVYAYTNYRKLPTIILTGKRGVGKNVVADLIGNIYNPLSVYWKPEESNFNPELQKKLLIADEAVTKDIKNYTYLKKLSGQTSFLINEKFTPKYKVQNNISVIILSNRNLPIFAEHDELPTDSDNNQFFVFELKAFEGKKDSDLSEKLKRRLGHYVRTELKEVFRNLDISTYRYSIEVSITNEERRLFNSSISLEEVSADQVMRLVSEWQDKPNTNLLGFFDHGYLPLDTICSWKSIKDPEKIKILHNLRERGYVTGDDATRPCINVTRKYCYKMTDKFKDWLKSARSTGEQADQQARKAP